MVSSTSMSSSDSGTRPYLAGIFLGIGFLSGTNFGLGGLRRFCG